MAFDLSTAKPVADDASAGGGFDISTARPTIGSTPLKIGKDAFPDILREELKNAGWLGRNLAGAGSAVVNAYEGLKGLVGKTDPDQVEAQKIIAESAPVGNIAGSVAMLAPTALIPGANTLTGAATIGAVTNALTTPGGVTERAKAGVFGGMGGAAGAGLSRLAGRAAPAVASPGASTLARESIQLTPGQYAGGALKNLEDKATSWPVVGGIINNARRRGVEDFNRAAINRATLPGMTVDGVGNQAIADLRRGLGDAYDATLANLSADALEPQFVQRIASLRSMVSALPEREQRAFDAILEREIGGRMAPNGRINADNLQAVKSGLGEQATNFSGATDGYQRQLGQAIKQAEAELRDLVMRSNPQNAQELQAIDAAYANFKRLQRAASSVGTEDGVFTPAQLHNAAKAMDRTKDKRAFAEGDALMQDLTSAGKAVLPSKVPDSGTAGRLLSNVWSPTGALSTLAGLLLGLPAAAVYSRAGSRAINGATAGAMQSRNALYKLLADNPNLVRIGGTTAAPKLMSQSEL